MTSETSLEGGSGEEGGYLDLRELNAIYLTSRVTLAKLYSLSAPQLPKFLNEANATSPARLSGKVKGLVQGWVFRNSLDVRFSWGLRKLAHNQFPSSGPRCRDRAQAGTSCPLLAADPDMGLGNRSCCPDTC